MGGGLLRTNNQLERFTKDKRNKKIIYSILGILLVIGSITLYKTFAFYEEKKSFNILKGRIPDFGYDIKLLSVVVDDKKSESIPERGLYKTNVHCTNGTFGEWDYNNWNLVLNNVSSESKCSVEFTSGLSEEEYNKYIEAGKALHRNTYRGKDITRYYTDRSLYTRISNGSFEDIYVGDYIKTIHTDGKEYIWLIADIDNYLYSGDTPLTKHHATIIPATTLGNASMNDTHSTLTINIEGYQAYMGSKMVSEILLKQLIIIKNIFGDSHVLKYRNILTTKMSTESISSGMGTSGSGASSEWAWFEREIDLMSEMNVYGAPVASSNMRDTGIDNRQYAIFQLKPEYINSYINPETNATVRFNYWLKNVTYKPSFAIVSSTGGSFSNGAADSYGIRPRFLLG